MHYTRVLLVLHYSFFENDHTSTKYNQFKIESPYGKVHFSTLYWENFIPKVQLATTVKHTNLGLVG